MILRNPKFGNSWQIDTKVKTDYTAGGNKLLQVHDPDWPIIDRFEITLENLSLVQKDELENFLVTMAGQPTQLTDFEGRTWEGIFVTNPITFSELGRGCKWSVSLEFEGQIIEGGNNHGPSTGTVPQTTSYSL